MKKIELTFHMFYKLAADYTAPKQNMELCYLATGKKEKKELVECFMPTEITKITNISNGSLIHYIMEPQEMMDILKNTSIINQDSDVELCAIIHSHPRGQPIPSETDINIAKKSGYKVPYIILGLNDVGCLPKAYYWTGEKFENMEIKYVPDN